MHEHNTQRSSRIQPRHLLIALAAFAVGGATMAATGGFSALGRLLNVSVEVDGQRTDLTLAEQGETTFKVDTADGGTATVSINSEADENGGMMRQVQVVRGDDSTQDEEVMRMVRRRAEAPETVDWEVLGDAEAAASWVDVNGIYHEVYLIENDTAEGAIILVANDPESETGELIKLTEVPHPLAGPDYDTTISADKNGLITVRADNGMNELEFKLRAAFGAPGELPDTDRMELETPDGQIRIRVQDAD